MRHLRILQVITIAAVTLLASGGAIDQTNAAVVEIDVESCVQMGDVFQLDVPGTYVAFAIGSSGPLLTDVRGNHGEMLATSHPTMSNTATVDLLAAFRFGIAPPQVFEVESSVIIHVQHDDSPYELVLIRMGREAESSRLEVRPPVERVVNESGSCLIGDLRESFKIHTEAVYSETGARQVFLIDSPSRVIR